MTNIGHEGPSVVGADGRPLIPEGIQPKSPDPERIQGDFNYYAWGRLGRILIQRPFRVAFEQTPPDQSFRHVDVFSSTPWLREVMRGQIARHYYLKQANAVIDGLEADFKKRADGVFPGVKRLRQEKLSNVRKLLSERQLPRQILQAAVFELLFDPEHLVGIMTQREERLSEYFLERFQAFPARYLTDLDEGTPKGDSGSWRSLVIDEVPVSFADIVGNLTDIPGHGSLTPDEAETLLQSMADHFSRQLSGKIQPAPRFTSFDLEEASLFRRFAYRNFPLESLKTVFFKNVLSPDRHVAGNARNLDGFEDGSISVYSAIEGFPFYAEYFSESEGAEILSEAGRVLRAGGKLIMFPWIARNGMDLGVFQETLRRLGFRVVIENISRKRLLGNMSERELKLMERSLVFTTDPEREFFPCLYATKKAD